MFQELEEIYSDLCSTVAEAVLQDAEIVSTRVRLGVVCLFFARNVKRVFDIFGKLCVLSQDISFVYLKLALESFSEIQIDKTSLSLFFCNGLNL